MKKTIDEFKTTVNRSIYNRCKRILDFTGCIFCPIHRGCNYAIKPRNNNWKKHRKTQYRN